MANLVAGFTPKKETKTSKWTTPTQSSIPSKIKETRLSEQEGQTGSHQQQARPLPKFDLLEMTKQVTPVQIPKPTLVPSAELTPNSKATQDIATLQARIEETRRKLENEKIKNESIEMNKSANESGDESVIEEFTLSEVPSNIMSSTVRPSEAAQQFDHQMDEEEEERSTLIEASSTQEDEDQPTLVQTGHSLSYINKQFDFLPDSTTEAIKEQLTSPRRVTEIRKELGTAGTFEAPDYNPDKNKKKR